MGEVIAATDAPDESAGRLHRIKWLPPDKNALAKRRG